MKGTHISLLQRKALTLFEKGRYQAAVDACAKILTYDPNNYEALFYQALGMYELGQIKHSLESWYRLKRMGPRQKNVHLNIGCAYHRIGRLDLAIRYYKRELVLYPACGEALYSLGTLYYQREQFTLAIPYLERCLAIKHCPERIMRRLALSYSGAARCRDEQELYDNWLRVNPKNSWVLNNFGASLAQSGEFGRAELYLRRAATVSPRDICILKNLRTVRSVRSEGNIALCGKMKAFVRMPDL